MDIQDALVNAIAEALTVYADREQEQGTYSIVSGASLDVPGTLHIGAGGFAIKLRDGSRYAIRIARLNGPRE